MNMTVQQLINVLLEKDPNAEVVVPSSTGGDKPVTDIEEDEMFEDHDYIHSEILYRIIRIS